MFHRATFVSMTAAAIVAVILLLVAFSPSFSTSETAHADHSSRPTVSIKTFTPAVGEEGNSIRITLGLSRPLTADEKFCYDDSGTPSEDSRRNYPCIEGGVAIWDDYDDHLVGHGNVTGARLVKFVFFSGQTEDRVGHTVTDDQCITPGRTVRIGLYTAFQDLPGETVYGYDIDTTQYTIRIAGNDETNGKTVDEGGKCPAVDDGATEEVFINSAPYLGTQSIERSIDENTDPGEDIGSPVTADDEENDTLEYSLSGTDASHFDIDSSTGQILTDGELDYETKHTYHLAVQVTDGKDIVGDSDSAIDDSIDVTIRVNDVNEPPVFDSGIPTSLNVVENTAAGENIGDPVTATDPEQLTVTYELDDGDGASFEIDSAGQIKTKADLMDQTQSTYEVTVTASDPGGNEAEHDVTITVTDANDPPAFKDDQGDVLTSTTREVAENTAVDQPVGDPVAATDEENDSLTYSLDTTGAASFDIESSTGQIKTKEGVTLDYESGTTSYSVTVSVTDGKDINDNAEDPPVEDASIEVTINVTDVNEGPAFADAAPATQDVAENTAADYGYRQPLHGHRPGERHADLLAGRDGRGVFRHRHRHRPAQDQGGSGLRERQDQLHRHHPGHRRQGRRRYHRDHADDRRHS